MSIYIRNAKLDGNSTHFSVTSQLSGASHNGQMIYERARGTYSGTNFATHTSRDRPAFMAYSSSNPGFVFFGSSYTKINNYNTQTTYNKNSCYNTSNTYFTAQTQGPYLFTWTSYGYTSQLIDIHFFVNGSISARRYDLVRRTRGHGYGSGYPIDFMMEEIIYLYNGDYVDVRVYGFGNSYHYPYYSIFSGIFVG